MHICLPDMRKVKPAHGSAFLLYNVHIDGLYHCSLRYKQFLHLHQALSKQFNGPHQQLPPFPPKKLLPLSAPQVEERRIQLERYLQTISQDKTICNSSIFNLFLLEAQRESTRIRESQVHLNIELVNGHKIRLQILSHDSADAVLTSVCRALGLDYRYHAYFCLCLCAYDVIRDKLIIKRKLSNFESPYVTLQMAIQQQDQLQSVLQSANYNNPATSSAPINDDSSNTCRCLSCLNRQHNQAGFIMSSGTTVATTDENSIINGLDSNVNYDCAQPQQCNGYQQHQEQAFHHHNGSSSIRSSSSSSSSSSSTTNVIAPAAFVTHRILLRISYWDPIYDTHILNDSNALNLLFIQTVYDIKHSLMFVNKDTYNQLETLLAADMKKEYIMLARTLKYYNYVHFEPCLSDYPKPRTKVMISIGSKELNMRVLKTPKSSSSSSSSSAAAASRYNTYGTTSTTTTNALVGLDNLNDNNTLAINQVSNTDAPTPTPTSTTINTTIATTTSRGDSGTTNQQVSEDQILYCTSSLVPSGYHHLITRDDLIEEEYNFKIPLIRCWRLTSLETLNSNSSSTTSNHSKTTPTTTTTTTSNIKSKRKSISFFNSQSVVYDDNNNNNIEEVEQQNSFIRRNGSGAASLLAALTGGSIANEGTEVGGRKQIASPQFSQYELSFEYLISKDTLKWITISSDQAIFISISLQGVVDELVSKRDGRSSMYKPIPTLPPSPNGHLFSHGQQQPNNNNRNDHQQNTLINNNNNYIVGQNFTYMYRDGSKKQLIGSFQYQLNDKFFIGSSPSSAMNSYSLTLVPEQQQQQQQQQQPQQQRRSSAMLLLSSTSTRLSSVMSMSPETSTGTSASVRSVNFEISNFKKDSSPIINDAFEGVTNDDDL